MRIPLFILLAGVASTAVAQDPQQLDKETQARIRAERSAGGTGNITPEEKASANAGAGPHRTRPATPARREPREDAARPGEQPAAGATRGERLESGDARPDARRP
jgi:hypothetical protein